MIYVNYWPSGNLTSSLLDLKYIYFQRTRPCQGIVTHLPIVTIWNLSSLKMLMLTTRDLGLKERRLQAPNQSPRKDRKKSKETCLIFNIKECLWSSAEFIMHFTWRLRLFFLLLDSMKNFRQKLLTQINKKPFQSTTFRSYASTCQWNTKKFILQGSRMFCLLSRLTFPWTTTTNTKSFS